MTIAARGHGLVGQVLAGRYRVEAVLGSGGMGVVFRARDEQLDEAVALKMMTVAGEDDARRFHREVRLARRITHPNVARTHDIGEHEGQLFMTMELIAGRSLDAILEAGPLPPERAIEIALEVARGLAAAHEAGVVHRDLKPGNVLVEEGGRVVITDFGIAKSAIDPGGQTVQVVGTPLYMAPEQAMGEAVSPATDVYAFGLLVFEMLTARRPFHGDTPMAELMARCRGDQPDPAGLAQMPERLAHFVRRCLAVIPHDRPATAQALAAEIERWSKGSTAKTVAAEGLSGFLTSGPLSSPFAPIVTTKRTLAVMPFSYRGASDNDYLGESLSQELIDVLSRTRNLRVLAFGATQAHHDGDPRSMGRTLGAEAVVTGTVLASGDKVRISARLVDVDSGVQLWTDRFDGGLEDIFALQETVSQRIADALRVELDTAAHGVRATAEAMDLYLRARRIIHQPAFVATREAVDLLDRCIEKSPDFGPALAAHAAACVRAWWSDMSRDQVGPWAERAGESVARAQAHAPELAETHLAHAMYALQFGDLRATAGALALALQIAPTLPAAHRYLGELQAEAGRVDEGLRRLKLAVELDPALDICLALMARVMALRGDYDRYEELLGRFERIHGDLVVPVVIMRARVSSWRRDEEALRRLVPAAARVGGAVGHFVGEHIQFLLGQRDVEQMRVHIEAARRFGNRRLESVAAQVAAEGLGLRGFVDDGLQMLEDAASGTLVDVEWLDRCPALDALRHEPRFAAVCGRVRERATTIWNLR